MLGLNDTQVTDAGLVHLQSLTNLRDLLASGPFCHPVDHRGSESSFHGTRADGWPCHVCSTCLGDAIDLVIGRRDATIDRRLQQPFSDPAQR